MSNGTLAGTVALGVGINSVHAIRAGSNPFPTAMAGGLLLGTLLAISAFVNGQLATTLAMLFLLGSFLFNGEVFINVMTNLAAPSPTPTGKKAKV